MEALQNNLKAGTRPPWVGLGAAVWVQIASGNAYTFPLYSHSLKSFLGFDQHQLTMLGVANDLGENVGLLPGIVCNRFPPWVILLIGAFACFCGYGVLWFALTHSLHPLPFWLLWLALCVATNSSAWLSTAVLVTNMRNFPLSRGTVAGILKGYGGLSAAVFTAIYSILLDNSSSQLLMFLAIGVPVLCFLVMHFVKACTPAHGEESAEHNNFIFIQVSSVVLGIYLLGTTVLDNFFQFSTFLSYALLVSMVILLMAPLAIPAKMTLYHSRTNQSDESPKTPVQGEEDWEKTQPLLKPSSSSSSYLGSFRENDVAILLAEGEGAVRKKRKPRRGEDFKFSEAVVKADFWLLFFVYFVGVGSGITVLNNLAQIGIAQGVNNTTLLLSLFSFCNFVGRLGGGFVSEHFVRSRTMPRTVWMTCTQLTMILTYLLFATSIDGTLYVATGLLGICYGCQFSIMIPTVSELFGLKHFGIFYNFMSLGNPLAAFLFSGLLAGYVYDTEASRQQDAGLHSSAKGITCLGAECFRLTFLVLAGLSGIGSVLSVVLTKRIKPVYEMLYAEGSFRLQPQSSNP